MVDSSGPYRLLRASAEPDVRWVRRHHAKMYVFTLVAVTGAIGFGIAGNAPAAAFFGGCALLLVQWLMVRTVLDRRTRTISRRHPWFGGARATSPIDPARLCVARYVEVSKGHKTITYRILSPDVVLAEGMGEREANELAAEMRAFLGTGSGPGSM
ncbi:MAG: hypothetical protein IT373_20270 [Polyangiaceae bacterium]|nr:hypothetical protein [Polyangiaceae bacterium]